MGVAGEAVNEAVEDWLVEAVTLAEWVRVRVDAVGRVPEGESVGVMDEVAEGALRDGEWVSDGGEGVRDTDGGVPVRLREGDREWEAVWEAVGAVREQVGVREGDAEGDKERDEVAVAEGGEGVRDGL